MIVVNDTGCWTWACEILWLSFNTASHWGRYNQLWQLLKMKTTFFSYVTKMTLQLHSSYLRWCHPSAPAPPPACDWPPFPWWWQEASDLRCSDVLWKDKKYLKLGLLATYCILSFYIQYTVVCKECWHLKLKNGRVYTTECLRNICEAWKWFVLNVYTLSWWCTVCTLLSCMETQ